MKYSMKRRAAAGAFLILCAAAIAWRWGGAAAWAAAEVRNATCWVMVRPEEEGRPGDYVNLRMWPSKGATIVGRLECGDGFQTDGETKNGFIHALDVGDCDCWVYAGYVVAEEPEVIRERYVVTAPRRVACRRWIDGPQVERKPWLDNGSSVTVYAIAGEWACTNRGFIQAAYLEADP